MKLFDPTGIKAKDYKSNYPELARTPEFEALSGAHLMFVWYYANATSPFIDLGKEERVERALDRSGYVPANVEHFLNLQFGESTERAIEKMASFIPGLRYMAWKALKNTFENYTEILNRSSDEFAKIVKDGKESYAEVDFNTYSNVTTRLTAAMPDLVSKLEEGYGVVLTSSEEEEESHDYIRDWNQNRQKR